jgi:hypothetical protein
MSVKLSNEELELLKYGLELLLPDEQVAPGDDEEKIISLQKKLSEIQKENNGS